ncbi:HNH endonuclease [Sphingobium lignivorans]|uniref:Restriction endonuclease n=1 Tax=Sphingobium lignivorans TaxID=2735886 RepID=A0ABR6NB14_9SPHN|nr:putative restriction endonuclease [Sphingobium lignivorans]
MTKSWSDAVTDAVRRHVAATGLRTFTRQALIDSQLDNIVSETGSAGATPHQTLSRELQQLRDRGLLEFLDHGIYRWMGAAPNPDRKGLHKGVFVIGSHSIYQDEPDRFYRFPVKWLANASKIEGNWIIYQEPRRAGRRGYYAVARFEKIVPDPAKEKMYLALIAPGSYLEFGRDVPFQVEGAAVERGLLNPDGRLNNGRAIQSIRPISDEDFNRIVGLGLVDEDELLPRSENAEVLNTVREEALPWHGPIDRATMLVNRAVRDRQFRKRVLDVYDCRCALTGMKLINGGGRAEAQAAHIMSVAAGGPDLVNNGIALSGTVHWMFDRGLISLSDDGEILLSRKINDIEGVRRLIHDDQKARFPISLAHRPHARYLDWHRRECFSP